VWLLPSGIFVLNEPLDKFWIFVVSEDEWFAGIEFADSAMSSGERVKSKTSNDDFSLAVFDFDTENVAIRFKTDGYVCEIIVEN